MGFIGVGIIGRVGAEVKSQESGPGIDCVPAIVMSTALLRRGGKSRVAAAIWSSPPSWHRLGGRAREGGLLVMQGCATGDSLPLKRGLRPLKRGLRLCLPPTGGESRWVGGVVVSSGPFPSRRIVGEETLQMGLFRDLPPQLWPLGILPSERRWAASCSSVAYLGPVMRGASWGRSFVLVYKRREGDSRLEAGQVARSTGSSATYHPSPSRAQGDRRRSVCAAPTVELRACR